MKKPRARIPKPPASYSGLTEAQWRSTPDLLSWAQSSQRFLEIGAVLTNGRKIAFVKELEVSEARKLGRAEGYEMALETFFNLAQGIPKQPASLEPTYQDDPQDRMPPQPTD